MRCHGGHAVRGAICSVALLGLAAGVSDGGAAPASRCPARASGADADFQPGACLDSVPAIIAAVASDAARPSDDGHHSLLQRSSGARAARARDARLTPAHEHGAGVDAIAQNATGGSVVVPPALVPLAASSPRVAAPPALAAASAAAERTGAHASAQKTTTGGSLAGLPATVPLTVIGARGADPTPRGAATGASTAGASAYASLLAELEKVAVPLAAIAGGCVMLLCGLRVPGLVAVYFGSQSGFSLYMKLIMSGVLISEDLDLKGVPAPFLVTGAQQLISFLIVLPASTAYARWRGGPGVKHLGHAREWVAVALYALAFSANIGLNNLSLSLIAVSLNLILRSCLPLVTLVAQLVAVKVLPLGGEREAVGEPVRPLEVSLMLLGVLCAAMATLASGESIPADSGGSLNYLFGVGMCVLSVVAASLNLVLSRFLGAGLDFNPIDAVIYTSVPCTALLMLPSLLVPHPVAWPSTGFTTDWEVFLRVSQLSPHTLGWVLVSGIFAAGYNVLQYLMVNVLSPTHTAFCGNFNKAATIALSIAMGFERLPAGGWGAVMVMAVLGNIVAFTGFSWLKASQGKGFGFAGEGGTGTAASVRKTA